MPPTRPVEPVTAKEISEVIRPLCPIVGDAMVADARPPDQL
jgi:hypothetical protein